MQSVSIETEPPASGPSSVPPDPRFGTEEFTAEGVRLVLASVSLPRSSMYIGVF